MLYTKQIFKILSAEWHNLDQIMKKDAYYYLWRTSSNFKYCIDDDYSTYKIAIYFYECPKDAELFYLTDYVTAKRYIVEQFCTEVEFLIDCSLINVHTV